MAATFRRREVAGPYRTRLTGRLAFFTVASASLADVACACER